MQPSVLPNLQTRNVIARRMAEIRTRFVRLSGMKWSATVSEQIEAARDLKAQCDLFIDEIFFAENQEALFGEDTQK